MDFLYYPLVVKHGIEEEASPLIHVTDAPRGSHRHRLKDCLAILLSLKGIHHYTGEEFQNLVKETSNVYFSTQGSVTRAMQMACDFINKSLFDQNLANNFEDIRVAGSINLVVQHNNWLFVSQYGNTVTTLIAQDQYNEFGALEGQSESLGQNKRIQARLYQSEINPGDLILMNCKPPSFWSSYYLAGSAMLSMPQVKQKLLNQVSDDLEAIVLKCSLGNGCITVCDWDETVEEGLTSGPSPSEAEIIKEVDFLKSQEIEDGFNNIASNHAEGFQIEDYDRSGCKAEFDNTDNPSVNSLDSEMQVVEGTTEKPLYKTVLGINGKPQETKNNQAILGIAKIWLNLKTLNARLHQFSNRISRKISSYSRQNQVINSQAIGIILIIVIPLILILVSRSIYSRTGKTEQYNKYFEAAQNLALRVGEQKDPLEQYAYWAKSLEMVKEAEEYHVTQDSRMLFEKAQYLIDEMDLATRLNFRPALTGFFPEEMVIGRIRANSSGVYLLDKTSQSIVRIFLNTKGFYEIDDAFNCALSPFNGEKPSNLVDFVSLPANEENFKIMALDTQGNLLYCRPGELPASRQLIAPEEGWGRVSGVAYTNDVLYVLDAEKDSIWMFAGKDSTELNDEAAKGVSFSEKPKRYFDTDKPDLGGAIDLVVNQDDMYILSNEGFMIQCRYSSDKDVRLTECKVPSRFSDNRVGRSEKKPPVFGDASFQLMNSTRLPSASVFILDSKGNSVYQFSYLLNLERILRAQENKKFPIPSIPPTGFGVTPESDIFLAFNNQLFVAPLK